MKLIAARGDTRLCDMTGVFRDVTYGVALQVQTMESEGPAALLRQLSPLYLAGNTRAVQAGVE